MTDPTSPPTVRPLTLADLPRLVALEHELFGLSAWSASMVREELTGPGRWYIGVDGAVPGPVGAIGTPVPTTRRDLVAYAGLWFDGDVTQVMTLGVALAAQRRGLGALLVDHVVRHSRELAAHAVILEVRVDNSAAIALYERFGFTVLGRRRRYYQPEDVDAFTMRLLLPDGT